MTFNDPTAEILGYEPPETPEEIILNGRQMDLLSSFNRLSNERSFSDGCMMSVKQADILQHYKITGSQYSYFDFEHAITSIDNDYVDQERIRAKAELEKAKAQNGRA